MYSTSSSSFGSTSSNNTSLVQVWVLQVNVRHVSCQQVYVRSSLCYVTIFVIFSQSPFQNLPPEGQANTTLSVSDDICRIIGRTEHALL